MGGADAIQIISRPRALASPGQTLYSAKSAKSLFARPGKDENQSRSCGTSLTLDLSQRSLVAADRKSLVGARTSFVSVRIFNLCGKR